MKTAWHGPGDVSPIGHMCNLHLDLASPNFGVQEGGVIRGVEAEIFRGCETFKDGYLYANDAPGWGIEMDEKLAAKYPVPDRRGAREPERRLGRHPASRRHRDQAVSSQPERPRTGAERRTPGVGDRPLRV